MVMVLNAMWQKQLVGGFWLQSRATRTLAGWLRSSTAALASPMLTVSGAFIGFFELPPVAILVPFELWTT